MFWGPVSIDFDNLDAQTNETLIKAVTGCFQFQTSLLNELARRGVFLPVEVKLGKPPRVGRTLRPREQTAAYARQPKKILKLTSLERLLGKPKVKKKATKKGRKR